MTLYGLMLRKQLLVFQGFSTLISGVSSYIVPALEILQPQVRAVAQAAADSGGRSVGEHKRAVGRTKEG